MLNLTKCERSLEVIFGSICHSLFKQDKSRIRPRLHIRRYHSSRRMALKPAPVKLRQFLFYSYLTTEKSPSTVDVPGKLVAELSTNISNNVYVLWSSYQAFWYAGPSSKLLLELRTSLQWWYVSDKALCRFPVFSISSILDGDVETLPVAL